MRVRESLSIEKRIRPREGLFFFCGDHQTGPFWKPPVFKHLKHADLFLLSLGKDLKCLSQVLFRRLHTSPKDGPEKKTQFVTGGPTDRNRIVHVYYVVRFATSGNLSVPKR